MPPDRKAWFLVGPTAVGKTAVAQWLAEREGFDILSADSMLVYQGMDIGTAKPDPEDRARVRYHGLDLCAPDRTFSVWDYRRCALEALDRIRACGRKPLVAGGSGLYIKSLTDGLAPKPGADAALRCRWEAAGREPGIEALQAAVRTANPERYEALADKENPRRLIRALETAHADGSASWKAARERTPLVGLALATAELNSRIEARVRGMYRRGLADEVRDLLARFPELSATARQAIGYAEAIEYVSGRCSRAEAEERTIVRTRQLAKRQRTWFRHQADVRWIQIEPAMSLETVAGLVLAQWRALGPADIAE
jgi:tRNA dimethylallyltransferase